MVDLTDGFYVDFAPTRKDGTPERPSQRNGSLRTAPDVGECDCRPVQQPILEL